MRVPLFLSHSEHQAAALAMRVNQQPDTQNTMASSDTLAAALDQTYKIVLLQQQLTDLLECNRVFDP